MLNSKLMIYKSAIWWYTISLKLIIYNTLCWWYTNLRFDDMQFLWNWWYTRHSPWFVKTVWACSSRKIHVLSNLSSWADITRVEDPNTTAKDLHVGAFYLTAFGKWNAFVGYFLKKHLCFYFCRRQFLEWMKDWLNDWMIEWMIDKYLSYLT